MPYAQQEQQQPPFGATYAIHETTGHFNGADYRIDHRDSNTLLVLRLHPDVEIKARPGSMVAMDPSVKIRGKVKFSLKNLFTDTQMSQSVFTGPGEILLAPEIWGDIVPIQLNGGETWSIGKHAFLAATAGVEFATKSQGLGRALFSGEGFFVREVTGQGIIFVQSLGAVLKRTLQPGEEWVVDNGHLVAWSASYKIERIQAGGLISSANTDEGLVCRFVGPGSVYIQTRNAEALIDWIKEQLPSSSRSRD